MRLILRLVVIREEKDTGSNWLGGQSDPEFCYKSWPITEPEGVPSKDLREILYERFFNSMAMPFRIEDDAR